MSLLKKQLREVLQKGDTIVGNWELCGTKLEDKNFHSSSFLIKLFSGMESLEPLDVHAHHIALVRRHDLLLIVQKEKPDKSSPYQVIGYRLYPGLEQFLDSPCLVWQNKDDAEYWGNKLKWSDVLYGSELIYGSGLQSHFWGENIEKYLLPAYEGYADSHQELKNARSKKQSAPALAGSVIQANFTPGFSSSFNARSHNLLMLKSIGGNTKEIANDALIEGDLLVGWRRDPETADLYVLNSDSYITRTATLKTRILSTSEIAPLPGISSFLEAHRNFLPILQASQGIGNKVFEEQVLPAYRVWKIEQDNIRTAEIEEQRKREEYENSPEGKLIRASYGRAIECFSSGEGIENFPLTALSIHGFSKAYSEIGGEAKSKVDGQLESFFILSSKQRVEEFVSFVLVVSGQDYGWGILMRTLDILENYGKAQLTNAMLLQAAEGLKDESELSIKMQEFREQLERLVRRGRVSEFFSLEQQLSSGSKELGSGHKALLLAIANSPFLSQIDGKGIQLGQRLMIEGKKEKILRSN